MARRADRAGEFELIARHFAPLAAGAPLAFGLTDDAAVLRAAPGRDLVLTTDTIIAGVHFLPDDPPRSIAQKLLRVNLSDLAAKGAKPRAYLMNCSFPRDIAEEWISAFAAGLAEDQTEYGILLIGGDTTATHGPLTLSATAIGEVPRAAMIRRKGARIGDGVWVSGNIGDAGLGLRVLKGVELGLSETFAAQCVEHYRLPKPRLALGAKLRGVAHACLDISDGLVADLEHMCEASSVGAEILADGIPISAAARRAIAAGKIQIGDLLTAGDDYELIFAVGAKDEPKLARIANVAGIKATRIGRITRGKGVTVIGAQGHAVQLERGGYRHF
jgi:thiamine-monophosphate kinase